MALLKLMNINIGNNKLPIVQKLDVDYILELLYIM